MYDQSAGFAQGTLRGHDSSEVIRGHQHLFVNNSGHNEDRELQLTPVCFSRQDTSTDMQHDLVDLDLDLRSFFLS